MEIDPAKYHKQIRLLLNENPQAFLSAAVKVMKTQADSRGAQFVASLLVSSGLILAALCDPSLTHEQALEMARLAMRPDTMRDVVLGRVSADRVASSRLIRILEEKVTGKDYLPHLLRLLRQPNPYLRSKAVLMLARDTRNVNWVRKTLADGDPRIRANAVEALWGVDTPEARELLESLREDGSNRVAGNALLGLYRLGEARVIPAIVAMASHETPIFRSTAAWVMGETGHPRFAQTLSSLMKDPEAGPRKAAIAALDQIRKSAARANRMPVRRLAAHFPGGAAPGRRRVVLALATLAGAEAAPVLPTHLVLKEDGRAVHHYDVVRPDSTERSNVVFIVPSSESGSSSCWSGYAAACLNVKQSSDAWCCLPYVSGVLQSGDTPAGDTALRFQTGEPEIREEFARIPLLPTRTDVWHAIWRAVQSGSDGNLAGRHLIICNDSPSDRAPGPGLISSVASSGCLVQVISSVANSALESLCAQVNGIFRLGRTPAILAALVEQACLNLQIHYEISYQAALPAPKTLHLTLCHPMGWGETTIPIPQPTL